MLELDLAFNTSVSSQIGDDYGRTPSQTHIFIRVWDGVLGFQ
jgi:hypothetical protein